MTPNPQAAIHHKCRELILLLQVNLNHFPRHEKYGLCQEIRQCVYGVLAGIVECQKRYHNKTSLTKLDVQHEQLRVFVNLAFELGYFSFEHHKRARSESEALRRYTAVSVLVNELGAMVYLNPLDHFIKRELGIARYVRYVDDFILFDLDRDQAHQLRERIETWLAERLRLELSKWSIHPVKRGVNFVGFRTWRKTRFVRKHSLCNFSRALRQGKTASVVSALGHARRTASFAHMARRCAEVPAVLAELPPIVRLSFGALHAPV